MTSSVMYKQIMCTNNAPISSRKIENKELVSITYRRTPDLQTTPSYKQVDVVWITSMAMEDGTATAPLTTPSITCPLHISLNSSINSVPRVISVPYRTFIFSLLRSPVHLQFSETLYQTVSDCPLPSKPSGSPTTWHNHSAPSPLISIYSSI
ncbi:hypothetical protein GDO81_008674 [Engystomops pustulosus]|uniref:Uncharacterized protein n=1 Tax=Engystomops pustulosus TaxID=76066 RepID=A0AAV7CH20_ENGPU|nr:hypothetical protein GDO81_008674 [Engystomops pustulosus]